MNIFYDYYVNVIKSKYFKYDGRASRSEFWYFALFNFIFSIIFAVLDMVLDLSNTIDIGGEVGLGTLYAVLVMFPSSALTFRRLHDIGKSAWWLLLFLIPILGWLALAYLYAKEGERVHNNYGSSLWVEASENTREDAPRNMLMEESENAGKGQKIIKMIGITLLVIFVILGGLFLVMGTAIFSIGKAVVESANSMPIENHIEEKNGKIEITVPLEEQYELKYENLKLCTPTEKKTDVFFKGIDAGVFGASSVCNNGNCTVSIGLENDRDYPKSIFAYVKEGVSCQKKRISTTTKPIVNQYEALIDMTPKLLKLLAIEKESYKISVVKTQSFNTWQLMGTKKVAFYYKLPLASDTLMIDGVEKAKLVYVYKNTNKVVQAPKAISKSEPKLQPKALTLEEKKKALEEELKRLQEEEIQALKEAEKALLEELKALKG